MKSPTLAHRGRETPEAEPSVNGGHEMVHTANGGVHMPAGNEGRGAFGATKGKRMAGETPRPALSRRYTGAPSPDAPAASDGRETTPVPLRPHHLLCLLGFRGHGYSDVFTANMAALAVRLRGPGGADTPLVIQPVADAICAPCPRRRGTGCLDADRIAMLDRRHAARLGLAPGARLTWGEALARIGRELHPDDLDTLCDGCRWLPLGLCRAALETLRATSAAPPSAGKETDDGEGRPERDTTTGRPG